MSEKVDIKQGMEGENLIKRKFLECSKCLPVCSIGDYIKFLE